MNGWYIVGVAVLVALVSVAATLAALRMRTHQLAQHSPAV